MSDELPDVIDHTGEKRALGLLPVREEHRMMRAGLTNFREYLRSIGKDLFPRSQWVVIDRRTTLGTKFINDQKSFGACVGFSAAQALMRQRALAGMTFQKLSGAYVYAYVNGDRDRGAVIADALAVVEAGVCLESEFNVPNIYKRDIPAVAKETAKRFALARGLTIDSFDECATAIQMGLIPQFPIQVGANFEKFVNGVAGVTKGPGNHSVHADGMSMIGGKWVLDMPNSWSPNWGPFKNGRCFLTEAAFAGAGGEWQDSYVMIDPTFDPQDPNLPPAPVG